VNTIVIGDEMISLLIVVVMSVSIATLIGYWAVNKVIDDDEITKITKIKIGFIVPFSLFSPLLLSKLIDGYAFFAFLITVPLAIFLIKKLSVNNDTLTDKSFVVYRWTAWNILLAGAFLGAIAKAVTYVLK